MNGLIAFLFFIFICAALPQSPRYLIRFFVIPFVKSQHVSTQTQPIMISNIPYLESFDLGCPNRTNILSFEDKKEDKRLLAEQLREEEALERKRQYFIWVENMKAVDQLRSRLSS